MKKRYAIVVHGGAGDEIVPKTPEEQAPYLEGLRKAVDAGKAVLERGGSALDAVEAAVLALEDNPLFNAGKGAAFASDGTHRLDASVMRGDDQACGVVADVQCIKNPVKGARAVMEKSPYVLLSGEDADRFAHENGLQTVQIDEVLRPGDGGVIAVDAEGNAAVGFSTPRMWRGVADSDGRYDVMLD